jgi:hypothetical protein
LASNLFAILITKQVLVAAVLIAGGQPFPLIGVSPTSRLKTRVLGANPLVKKDEAVQIQKVSAQLKITKLATKVARSKP